MAKAPAKAMTKSQILAGVAVAAEITKKQAAAAVEALVAMAYKGAKIGFTVPGLGKLLLLADRNDQNSGTGPARECGRGRAA